MRIRLASLVLLPMMAISALTVGRGPQLMAQSSAPPAAPADQSAATLKIQAREVVLPVTVRDKHGALVTSLKMGDFTLTEDGRPETIKSFTRESNLPFRLGLLVDTSRSVSSALDNERKAAEKFVDQMLPADPGSVTPSSATPNSATQGDEAFLIH